MFKDVLKIIAIALIVFLVKGFGFADGNEYKNSLLGIDLKKVQNGSFKVILQTQKPYQEPLNVIKRSDTEYVIILPETYSSQLVKPSASDMGGEIADLDVSLFPYLSSSSNNGFTKITISTNSKIQLKPIFYAREKQTEAAADAERIASVAKSNVQKQKVYVQSDFTAHEKQRIASSQTKPLEKKDLKPKEATKKEIAKETLPETAKVLDQKELTPSPEKIAQIVEQQMGQQQVELKTGPTEEVEDARESKDTENIQKVQMPNVLDTLISMKNHTESFLRESFVKTTNLTNSIVDSISIESRVKAFANKLVVNTTSLAESATEKAINHYGFILLSLGLILLIPMLVLAWLKRRLSGAEMQNVKIVSPKSEVISEKILTPTVSYKAQDKPATAPTLRQGVTRNIHEQERFDKFQVPEDRVNVFANPVKIFEKKQKPVKAEIIEEPKVIAPIEKEPELISQFVLNDFSGFYFIRYENHLALVGYIHDKVLVLKKLDDLSDLRFKVFKGHKAGNNQMYMIKTGKHFGLYRVEAENIKFVMNL